MNYPRLLRAIETLYRRSPVPMLARAADELARLAPTTPRPGGGARKPVCRHIARALSNAARAPLNEIGAAFAAVEPQSDWLQNPNYTETSPGRAFLDNYGYVEIVGAGRPFESRAFLVGFLLLGPGALYPRHTHAAEEVYHVVTGRSRWWREGGDWHLELPGAAIHYPPNVAHAMRCGGNPLLALYCWAGKISAAAQLSKS